MTYPTSCRIDLWRTFSLFALAAVSVAVVACNSENISSSDGTPNLEQREQAQTSHDNEYVPPQSSVPVYDFDFPDSSVGIALDAFMAVQLESGPDAMDNYVEALGAVRENPESSIEVLMNAYAATDGEMYQIRWRLVQAVGEVPSSAAITPLTNIALEPVPARTSSDGGYPYSEVDQELRIRVRAVGGLGKLHYWGISTLEQLEDIVLQQDDRTVQAAAFHELIKRADYTRTDIEDRVDGTDRDWVLDQLDKPDIQIVFESDELHQPTSEVDIYDWEDSAE